MKKKITHNLNEGQIRAALENYEPEFDEETWRTAEKKIDALGIARQATFKGTVKKISVFSVLTIIAIGLVAFISYTKQKNTNNTYSEFNSVTSNDITLLNSAKGIAVRNDLPILIMNRKAAEISVRVLVSNSDTAKEMLVAENRLINIVDVKIKEEKSEESLTEAKKESASTDKSSSKKKKKKKKKKKHATSSKKHLSGEDDVIISQ